MVANNDFDNDGKSNRDDEDNDHDGTSDDDDDDNDGIKDNRDKDELSCGYAWAYNANIHANDNIEMEGATNVIYGFGTYGEAAKCNPSKALQSSYQPRNNPDNLPGLSQGPDIDVPLLKCAPFLSLVKKTTTGGLSLSGEVPLGSKNNRVVWYVTGDLTIKGKLSGYGVFLVRGNVKVIGNATVTIPDENDKSTVGIYSEGDVEIFGNAMLRGQVLSAGNFIMNGNSKLCGSAVAYGNIVLKGTVDVYYREANPVQTSPFWPARARATIISYLE